MNERLFDGKGEIYAQFRPSYPPALFDFLRDNGVLNPSSDAADIGAGTGIFTRLLASRVRSVLAVEPNDDMRREGMRLCPGNVRFVSGSAESAGLPDASLDLVTAAQAFHWFDRDAFRTECRRILRPGGWVLLVWNQRDENSPLIRALADLNRKFCPRFKGFSSGGNYDVDGFFQGRFRQASFPNDSQCTEEAFIGRCLSSSYAPGSDDLPYRQALSGLFRRSCQEGVLSYPYVTVCFFGRLSDLEGDAIL